MYHGTLAFQRRPLPAKKPTKAHQLRVTAIPTGANGIYEVQQDNLEPAKVDLNTWMSLSGWGTSIWKDDQTPADFVKQAIEDGQMMNPQLFIERQRLAAEPYAPERGMVVPGSYLSTQPPWAAHLAPTWWPQNVGGSHDPRGAELAGWGGARAEEGGAAAVGGGKGKRKGGAKKKKKKISKKRSNRKRTARKSRRRRRR